MWPSPPLILAARVRDKNITGGHTLSAHRQRSAAGLVERLVRKKDFYAGGLMILFGLVMSLKGPSYRLGTLMHMGPGFMPTALGILLICLGVAIAAGCASAHTTTLV